MNKIHITKTKMSKNQRTGSLKCLVGFTNLCKTKQKNQR